MELTETNKGQSIKITIEKLDGGYVSNATGKRSIYKDASDILDVVAIEKVLNNIDNDEYHLNIDLIPKSEYQDYMDLIDLSKNNLTETLTLEGAKESGLIEKEEFNPTKKADEESLNEIKVDISNAYSIGRLKSINWAELHEQLPMLPSEITAITGMNTTTLYASLPKARKGEFSFQNTQTRIGFTILSKYYEKTLGLRTSTKEQAEKTKETVLNCIREIELMGSTQKFIKTTELMKKLNAVRNELLK